MDKETYVDFLKKYKNVSSPRHHKISNSSGMAAAFVFYRHNRPQVNEYVLSRSQFDKIINQMNLLLIENLLTNKKVKLPCGLGTLFIDKFENKSFIADDGRLIVTNPVDIGATLKLWYEDEECFNNRTKVRYENDFTFRLRYLKKNARVFNMTYFYFNYGRDIKNKLKDRIKIDKTFDAYEQKQMDKY